MLDKCAIAKKFFCKSDVDTLPDTKLLRNFLCFDKFLSSLEEILIFPVIIALHIFFTKFICCFVLIFKREAFCLFFLDKSSKYGKIFFS